MPTQVVAQVDCKLILGQVTAVLLAATQAGVLYDLKKRAARNDAKVLSVATQVAQLGAMRAGLVLFCSYLVVCSSVASPHSLAGLCQNRCTSLCESPQLLWQELNTEP